MSGNSRLVNSLEEVWSTSNAHSYGNGPAARQPFREEQKMRKLFIPLLATVFCFVAADAYAKIIIKPPQEVPTDLISRDFRELTAKREPLMTQFYATQEKIDGQERNCNLVEANSPKANECIAEAQEVKSAVRKYREALKEFDSRVAAAAAWKKLISDMADKLPKRPEPHLLDIKSHGEFHITRADGSKLSDEEAANLTDNDDVKLETGADGGAFITLGDGTHLRLDENTVFVKFIPKATDPNYFKDKNSTMELVKGSLLWLHDSSTELIKRLPETTSETRSRHISEGKIRMSTAQVSERGTEFEGAVLPDGSGQIKLYSGEVSVTSKTGEEVILKPGQMLNFTKDKIGAVTQIP